MIVVLLLAIGAARAPRSRDDREGTRHESRTWTAAGGDDHRVPRACSAAGGALYNHFLSTLVLGDILGDNAFLIIAAIGANFVILSGGIDLSIGSMIGFVGVVMAKLDGLGWHPLASAPLMIAFGGRLRRPAGPHHRLLRDSAVHRHSCRAVPAARRLFHGHARFAAAAPSLRLGFRRHSSCRCPATGFWRVRRWRCSSRSPSRWSSRTGPRSAPTSTPSAAIAPRRR